ncbi:MAG: hypothetical protein LUH07_11420 [Lachnospiraceae bacterium]|nr:hypothetical protein [Lachnospiraceae bacterium]
MKNVTIISHLTPEEWKLSWKDKVVEDTKENMKEYQSSSCFWGHFSNSTDFTICHHKEFEIKGMSFGLYFNGTVEWDEKGSKITGKFGKKKTADLFLIAGIILCLLALAGATLQADREVSIVSSVLLLILIIFYLVKPKNGQERILNQLKKISFDDSFRGKAGGRRKGITKKKKKRSMREKARVEIREDKAENKKEEVSGAEETEKIYETAANGSENAQEENIEIAETGDGMVSEDAAGAGIADKADI